MSGSLSTLHSVLLLAAGASHILPGVCEQGKSSRVGQAAYLFRWFGEALTLQQMKC